MWGRDERRHARRQIGMACRGDDRQNSLEGQIQRRTMGDGIRKAADKRCVILQPRGDVAASCLWYKI